MTYTLHHELTDGTLDKPFHSVPSRAMALRICREAAKGKPWGVANFVVCKDDLSVATVKVRPFGSDE